MISSTLGQEFHSFPYSITHSFIHLIILTEHYQWQGIWIYQQTSFLLLLNKHCNGEDNKTDKQVIPNSFKCHEELGYCDKNSGDGSFRSVGKVIEFFFVLIVFNQVWTSQPNRV